LDSSRTNTARQTKNSRRLLKINIDESLDGDEGGIGDINESVISTKFSPTFARQTQISA
jgi:hypothetical protein